MSMLPDISVVMCVYNDSDSLRKSLDSILEQEKVNLELIVVNDGSTDNSLRILEEYKNADKRIKLLNQKHGGLTQALIIGCALAQGEYIARHDAGDVSEKIRLKKQFNLIKRKTDICLVSCGTQFFSPENDYLYSILPNPQKATDCLLSLQSNILKGPSHHGCAMFPTKLYEKVGGYRSAFYFAQDLDLWVRLAEQGKHIIIPEFLYNASVTAKSISGQYRQEQIKLTQLIIECSRRRRRGSDESAIIEQAKRIRPTCIRQRSHLDHARALYFIGKCLHQKHNAKANKYFIKAFLSCLSHLKSTIQMLIS